MDRQKKPFSNLKNSIFCPNFFFLSYIGDFIVHHSHTQPALGWALRPFILILLYYKKGIRILLIILFYLLNWRGSLQCMSIYAQRGNRMQPFLPVIPRSTQLPNFFFFRFYRAPTCTISHRTRCTLTPPNHFPRSNKGSRGQGGRVLRGNLTSQTTAVAAGDCPTQAKPKKPKIQKKRKKVISIYLFQDRKRDLEAKKGALNRSTYHTSPDLHPPAISVQQP